MFFRLSSMPSFAHNENALNFLTISNTTNTLAIYHSIINKMCPKSWCDIVGVCDVFVAENPQNGKDNGRCGCEYLRNLCRPMCCHPKSSNSNFVGRCLTQCGRSTVVDTLGIHFRRTILTSQIHVSFHFTTQCSRNPKCPTPKNSALSAKYLQTENRDEQKQMAKIKSIV